MSEIGVLVLRLMAIRHPSVTFTTQYLDAHIYVFRRTVLDLISARRPKDLDSVREQIVPWLCKGSWQESLWKSWDQSTCESSPQSPTE